MFIISVCKYKFKLHVRLSYNTKLKKLICFSKNLHAHADASIYTLCPKKHYPCCTYTRAEKFVTYRVDS